MLLLILFNLDEMFAQLTIWLASGLYSVAAWTFQIFLILANAEIVDKDMYEVLLNNSYLILGIVMLFIIAFSLLKMMINPDDQKGGTSVVKKVIINFVTSVLIIVLLPTIFGFAFDVQKSIITDNNVIGKFFGYGGLGDNESQDGAAAQIKSGANQIVNGVWTAFFNVNQNEVENCNPDTVQGLKECQENVMGEGTNLYSVINQVDTGEEDYYAYGQFAENISNDEITFNFLLSLLGGALLIYVGLSFCFDMAVRLVKLVFYQLIAPIPILLRVLPDGKLSGSFKQWTKVTLTCYFEVYVRIFTIYFCIYLCKAILESNFLQLGSGFNNFFTWLFTKAFIIMGIVIFMRRVPKLISEATGIDSGNMKLGIKEKLAEGGGFTAGALLGSGVTAGVRNATNARKEIINKYQENREKGQGKFEATVGSLKTAFKGVGSTVAGVSSGALRGAKSGMGAKSYKDMTRAASTAAAETVKKRKQREVYVATHGGTVGAMKGRATEALRGIQTWAGINAIDATEADRYTQAANAFDAAHAQAEGVYKNKPGHNKIKERVTEFESIVKRLESNEAELHALEDSPIPLDAEEAAKQAARINELRSMNIESNLQTAKANLKNAKAEQTLHEASEMSKKSSVQMEAINALVNAKMKYADLESTVFNDKLYDVLIKSGAGGEALANKIKNNEEIKMVDLQYTDERGNKVNVVDFNALEKFLDDASVNAKNAAAEKRASVAHAKALVEEQKGDNK